MADHSSADRISIRIVTMGMTAIFFIIAPNPGHFRAAGNTVFINGIIKVSIPEVSKMVTAFANA